MLNVILLVFSSVISAINCYHYFTQMQSLCLWCALSWKEDLILWKQLKAPSKMGLQLLLLR